MTLTDLSTSIRQDIVTIGDGDLQNIEISTAANSKFMVPYQRNANFTGRTELLAKLSTKLHDVVSKSWNHRVALYGLGGVGKTQLALEYVYTHKGEYDRVYWISAVSKATLFSGFQEIAKKTQCIPSITDLDPSEVAKRVLEWFNAQENCLLVIDNLDQIEVIDGYLPNQSQGQHTLITTRNPYCDHIPAEGLKVGELDLDDAIELLLLRSRVGAIGKTLEARTGAAEIVKELGYLPLAIEQAGAYIREASRDLFKFLPSYRKDRKIHHARLSKGNRSYYSGSVSTTWHLSFEKIEQNNSDASKLLLLLSFLNPDGILTDFLETGKEGLSAELAEIVSQDVRLNEALAELERFSLIGRQDDISSGQIITIHRLVQSVIKDDMSPDIFLAMVETVIGLCNSAFPYFDYNVEHELRLRGRRFRDQMVMPLLSIHHNHSREFGKILHRIGVFLRDDGNFQEAIELLAKAMDILDMIGGSEDSNTLNSMAALGWAYDVQGRWTDAVLLREKVLGANRLLHGDKHPDTLTAMANLASTYRNQGRWDEAVKLEEEVLAARARLLGKEHPDTLTAMANLASTYWNQGRWDEAVKLEEEVLAASARLLGKEHPDTLTAMANLASTYWNQGRWDEAVKLEEKVLAARARLLGKEHPDTLTAMANLASTYRNQGRWDEAVKLEEEVLAARTDCWGRSIPTH